MHDPSNGTCREGTNPQHTDDTICTDSGNERGGSGTGTEQIGGSSPEREGEQLSLDETFEILKNNRRRLVLKHLRDSGQLSLGELADHVTAVENDVDVSEITSTQRKRVYVGLYQFHLPKMAEMGVIEFDKDRGTVCLTERGRELIENHEQEAGTELHWHRYSLALATVGVLAAGISALTGQALVAIALLGLQALPLGVLGLYQRRLTDV